MNWRKLTKENMAEAKLDLRKLNDPAWGGFNLLYSDGFYAMSLQNKWGDLNDLDKAIKAMEAEAVSLEGAGI